jgi:hypothetical protein
MMMMFMRRFSGSWSHFRHGLTQRPRLEELESRLVLSLPSPDHIVMVIEENHAYSQIIGSSSAPYINSLAQGGALFTQSFAIGHPSEPNYLELFSGSNQGVTSDACPVGPFSTANLGMQLIGAGLTFGGYSESMPSVGYTGCTSGSYARKHNPWVDFNNVPAADNMPFAGYFPSNFDNLPKISIVVPNLQDDMHDGTVAMGDTWLRNNLQNYINWTTTHNSLFVLTFDEDDSAHGNQIATIFVGPMVQTGSYSERITHYNVLRTLEDIYGLPHAGGAGTASPITDVWTSPAPDHFAVAVNAANPDVAGTFFDVTVTAQDANGNTVTGYTGTVTFSSQDPYGASLPMDYTFQSSDQGQANFYGQTALYTAGAWDVTVSDNALGISGSTSVNVIAAPAAGFYVAAPSTVSSGVAFNVTLYAIDPYNNIDTNYGGTVAWSTTDPSSGVMLPPTYTFLPSDAGVAYFQNGVTLVTPGTWSVTATDISSGITGSATVTVTADLTTGLRSSAVEAVLFHTGLMNQLPAPTTAAASGSVNGTASDVWGVSLDRFFAIAENHRTSLVSQSEDAALGLVLEPPLRDPFQAS